MEPFVCDVVGIERLGGSELAGEGSPSTHSPLSRARAECKYRCDKEIVSTSDNRAVSQ